MHDPKPWYFSIPWIVLFPPSLWWCISKYSIVPRKDLSVMFFWKPRTFFSSTILFSIHFVSSAETDLEEREALALVHADGLIRWYPHSIFRSSCAIDATNFPFDEQICNMWFGSWTHTSQLVDLQVSFATSEIHFKVKISWHLLNKHSYLQFFWKFLWKLTYSRQELDLHCRWCLQSE